jgi:hypothetical protein
LESWTKRIEESFAPGVHDRRPQRRARQAGTSDGHEAANVKPPRRWSAASLFHPSPRAIAAIRLSGLSYPVKSRPRQRRWHFARQRDRTSRPPRLPPRAECPPLFHLRVTVRTARTRDGSQVQEPPRSGAGRRRNEGKLRRPADRGTFHVQGRAAKLMIPVTAGADTRHPLAVSACGAPWPQARHSSDR